MDSDIMIFVLTLEVKQNLREGSASKARNAVEIGGPASVPSRLIVS
jgi:hypothetical protein